MGRDVKEALRQDSFVSHTFKYMRKGSVALRKSLKAFPCQPYSPPASSPNASYMVPSKQVYHKTERSKTMR